MKKLICCLFSICSLSTVFAQLKSSRVNCPTVIVDIMDGKVNGLRPDRTTNEIKGKLPCFTSADDEGSSAKCGGNVFYKDKDIYFYTDRNYVEIKSKFKGKLSVPLLGAKRNSLFKLLGNPKIKDTNWDAYQMGYGVLIVYYGADSKINKIQFSTMSTDNIQLCE